MVGLYPLGCRCHCGKAGSRPEPIPAESGLVISACPNPASCSSHGLELFPLPFFCRCSRPLPQDLNWSTDSLGVRLHSAPVCPEIPSCTPGLYLGVLQPNPRWQKHSVAKQKRFTDVQQWYHVRQPSRGSSPNSAKSWTAFS